MKLNKTEQRVVKHGVYQTPSPLIYPSNICPECGHDITDEDSEHFNKIRVRRKKLFNTYLGTEVTFTCPECGCVFVRGAYDTVKANDCDEQVSDVAGLVISFVLKILFGWLFYECVGVELAVASVVFAILMLICFAVFLIYFVELCAKS